VNHKIGYMYLKFNEISLSSIFPVVYISSLKPGNITWKHNDAPIDSSFR